MVKEEKLTREDVDPNFKTDARFIDITGMRFGKIVVLGVYKREGRDIKLVAECDCGNIIKTSRNKIYIRGKRSCVDCSEIERIKPVKDKIDTLLSRRKDLKVISSGDGLFKSNWSVQCTKCTEFYTLPYSSLYLGTKGCSCSAITRRSLEEKEKYLDIFCLNRHLIFLGWINNTTQARMFCSKHQYEYPATFWNMYKGKGCKKCGRELLARIKADTLSDFIEKAKFTHGDSYSYDKVVYVNQNTNVWITCNTCGKDNYQKPNNHLQGKGCKYCASRGFSPTKPCNIYVMKFTGLCEEFYKVGVTNNLSRRKRDFNAHWFDVELLYNYLFDTGSEAKFLESLVLASVPCKYIGKDLLPDGYTETFHPDYLENVFSLIRGYLE